jgi:hypothetical protein
MLFLRVFLVVIGILIVISLLGYALNRDPRWLKFAGLSLKGGFALILLLMLLYAAERLLIAL